MKQFATSYLYAYNEEDERVVAHKVGRERKIKSLPKKNVSFYGVEIELERRPGTRWRIPRLIEILTAKVNNRNLRFYAKHDGSLRQGAEFVSNPLSVSAWTSQFRMVRKFFKVASKYWKVTDRCGLHIHISRDSFVDGDHFSRFCNFILANLEFFGKISRRTDPYIIQQYCSFNGLIELTNRMHLNHMFDMGLCSDKYLAVRLCKETVEVRFFSGTADWEEMIGRIQLIDIIKTFCIRHDSYSLEVLQEWGRNIQKKWLKNSWKWGMQLLEKEMNIPEKKETPVEAPSLPPATITNVNMRWAEAGDTATGAILGDRFFEIFTMTGNS